MLELWRAQPTVELLVLAPLAIELLIALVRRAVDRLAPALVWLTVKLLGVQLVLLLVALHVLGLVLMTVALLGLELLLLTIGPKVSWKPPLVGMLGLEAVALVPLTAKAHELMSLW